MTVGLRVKKKKKKSYKDAEAGINYQITAAAQFSAYAFHPQIQQIYFITTVKSVLRSMNYIAIANVCLL